MPKESALSIAISLAGASMLGSAISLFGFRFAYRAGPRPSIL